MRKSHLTSGRIRSCGCLYRNQKRGRSGPNKYVIEGTVVRGIDFKGNEFLFDVSDFDVVSPYQWYLNHDGYVVARVNGKNVTMHRFLVNEDVATVDHHNHKKNDNRRENLRVASTSENVSNKPKSSVGKPVIGVYQRKRNKKYEAAITKNGVRHCLGFFESYEEAVRARLLGEIKYFGEFAPQKHLFQEYGIT